LEEAGGGLKSEKWSLRGKRSGVWIMKRRKAEGEWDKTKQPPVMPGEVLVGC